VRHSIPRRNVLAGLAAGAVGEALFRKPAFGGSAPASTVAIARCRSYGEDFASALSHVLDQIGGVGSLVKGKTVALKLNLTGNITRFPNRPDLPYRNEPTTVLAVAHLLARAGARRIRILESFFPAGQDLALWARYGLDVGAISTWAGARSMRG
jgi:hypothetical protein